MRGIIILIYINYYRYNKIKHEFEKINSYKI